MKTLIPVLLTIFLISCHNSGNRLKNEVEMITATDKQDSLFNHLLAVTNPRISNTISTDSLAFLVLPVHASCPACRNKTIDSILKHKEDLQKNRYIIIAANGGRKTINLYFRKRGSEIPDIRDRLFLDSTNQGYKYDLYDRNPVIYYACNKKVFKKITAIPATVKQDLQEFFSGFRDTHTN